MCLYCFVCLSESVRARFLAMCIVSHLPARTARLSLWSLAIRLPWLRHVCDVQCWVLSSLSCKLFTSVRAFSASRKNLNNIITGIGHFNTCACIEVTKHRVPQASSTRSMAVFCASNCTISFVLFMAHSFALLALRCCYALRAPLCLSRGLSQLTLASGSWQPGALRAQAVRSLRFGFPVSFGNTIPQ